MSKITEDLQIHDMLNALRDYIEHFPEDQVEIRPGYKVDRELALDALNRFQGFMSQSKESREAEMIRSLNQKSSGPGYDSKLPELDITDVKEPKEAEGASGPAGETESNKDEFYFGQKKKEPGIVKSDEVQMSRWGRVFEDIENNNLQFSYRNTQVEDQYVLEVRADCWPMVIGNVWFTYFGDNIDLLHSYVWSEVRRCGLRTKLHQKMLEDYPDVCFLTGEGNEKSGPWLKKMGFKYDEDLENWILRPNSNKEND